MAQQRKPKFVISHVFAEDTPAAEQVEWLRNYLILNQGVHQPELDELSVTAEHQYHLFDRAYTKIFRVFSPTPRTTSLNA